SRCSLRLPHKHVRGPAHGQMTDDPIPPYAIKDPTARLNSRSKSIPPVECSFSLMGIEIHRTKLVLATRSQPLTLWNDLQQRAAARGRCGGGRAGTSRITPSLRRSAVPAKPA